MNFYSTVTCFALPSKEKSPMEYTRELRTTLPGQNVLGSHILWMDELGTTGSANATAQIRPENEYVLLEFN